MKQLSRIKLLSVLFILTGLVAAFVLFKDSTFNNNEPSSLKISTDSASLNKITLLFDTQSTVLTKGDNNWQVNGKYKARPTLIQNIVIALSKVEVKRLVAEENKKKIIDLLKQKGVRVNIEGDEWNKKFLISSNDNDANSSYYLEEGSSEPYIVYVPGITGDMAILFKMTEVKWRNRALFVSTPMSMQKVAVSYPEHKSSNVEIKWNSDKTFQIEGVNKVDTSKIINYLSQFEQVNVDSYVYENKDTIMASMRKNLPKVIIEVADLVPSGSHKLSIYNESKDPKAIYAIVEPENELVTMSPETLYRILVRKDFFEKK